MKKEKEVQVSKTVNLNINQGDLVDVMIEEFQEDLEKQLKETDKEVENMQEARKNWQNEFDHFTIDSVKDTPIYKRAYEFLASQGAVTVTVHKEVQNQNRWDNELVNGKDKWHYPVLDTKAFLEEGLKYQSLRNNSCLTYEDKESLTAIWVRMRVNQDSAYSKAPVYSISIPCDAKKLKKRYSEINRLKNDSYELHLKRRQIATDLIKANAGEKRFKAKFIKASLGKSVEGKQILDMMNSIKSGVKLLS